MLHYEGHFGNFFVPDYSKIMELMKGGFLKGTYWTLRIWNETPIFTKNCNCFDALNIIFKFLSHEVFTKEMIQHLVESLGPHGRKLNIENYPVWKFYNCYYNSTSMKKLKEIIQKPIHLNWQNITRSSSSPKKFRIFGKILYKIFSKIHELLILITS